MRKLFGASSSTLLQIDFGSLSAQTYSVAAGDRASQESESGKIQPLTTARGTVFLLRSIMKLGQEWGSPVLCLDKYPTRRLNIDPHYKEARFERYRDQAKNATGASEVPEGAVPSVKQQFRNEVMKVLNALPCFTVWAMGEEADDVMATMAARVGTISKAHSRAYTRDTDMLQLVGRPRTDVLLKSGTAPPYIVSPQVASDKYNGVRPDQIALYKSFLGDSGDSIPKMPSVFTRNIVSDIIGDRTTVQEVYDAYQADEINMEDWRRNWLSKFEDHLGEPGTGRAFINEQLARLNDDANVIVEYRQGDFNEFQTLYNEAMGPMQATDPMQIWSYFVSAATDVMQVFEKDQIPISTQIHQV